MLTKTYSQLNNEQKTLVHQKIAEHTHATIKIIKKILYHMNPPIRVNNGRVQLFRNTMTKIQYQVLQEKKNM